MRIIFRLAVAFLIISTVTSTFALQTLKMDSTTPTSRQTLGTVLQDKSGKEPKKDSLEYFRGLDYDNDTFVEFVIGVDASETQSCWLEDYVHSAGGKVTDAISSYGIVRTLCAKVPIGEAGVFIQRLRANVLVKYVEPNFRVEATYVPDDPSWPQQWGPKKIQADYAWNTTLGSSDVLVAVVDTGIDYTHPELAENYVPLGHDWVNNDMDPMDDHGHGTHCAGIVAAKINNSLGIAGLAQVRIMAEKVLSSGGYGFDWWIAQGIIHATDAGARIISMSLGGTEGSTVMYDAVRYANDHGVLVIAAAGNSHSDVKQYPAAYDEVVAVTATDSSDNLAYFSSYGNWVELSAPGVGIYSTIPGNSYASWSGTSMACPHVAGVAALVWSRFPNYTSAAVRYVLDHSVNDLGKPGFDEYYGYGQVNARKAILGIQPHDLEITSVQYPHRISPGESGIFNVTVSNCGSSNETGLSVQFFVNNTLTDSKTIDSLQSCYSTLVNFSWSSTILGSYNFTSYVVPAPGESITENNVVSSIVQVRFPEVLRVPSEYPTIHMALNNASNGDTVSIAEGYYTEGQIDVSEDGVILIADGHVVLNGQENDFVLNINANHVIVEGLEIRNGSKYGVSMKGFGNTFTRNSVCNNTNGLQIRESENSTISLNNITTMPSWTWRVYRYGLLIENSAGNSISQNNVTGGALWLCKSQGNFLTSNNVVNANFGLVFETSPYNTLRNNKMMNNTRNLSIWKWDVITLNYALQYPWQAINDVDSSNTVDDKPVYYLVGEHDKPIPSDTGCVILVNSKNITVENLDIKKNLNGILLLNTNGTTISRNNITATSGYFWEYYGGGIFGFFGSSNNLITLNNLTSNDQGIMFEWPSDNNTISQNTVTNSTLAYGIYINSRNSNVRYNHLKDNNAGMCIDGENDTAVWNDITASGYYSLLLQGPYHTIAGNNVRGGVEGLTLDWLADSVIFSNNVTAMTSYAVSSIGSTKNRIFHNNFVNYTTAYFCYVPSEIGNNWDNGYPSGGNYWSNYAGKDANHDRIGDTPYSLDADQNQADLYPLMRPFRLVRDLATAFAVIYKTVVGQGYGTIVEATVVNQGELVEICNVTLRVEVAVVAWKTVILETGESRLVTFTWNTAAWNKGSYLVAVEIKPLSGETDVANNSYELGIVKVTVPGDVNGDFLVNIQDASQLGAYWQKSTPPAPLNADVNGDGIINIKDATILGINWQKHA